MSEQIELKIYDRVFTFSKVDGEWECEQQITGPVMTPMFAAALDQITALSEEADPELMQAYVDLDRLNKILMGAVEALVAVVEDYKEILKDDGFDCDHDVGICNCAVIGLLAVADQKVAALFDQKGKGESIKFTDIEGIEREIAYRPMKEGSE